MFGCVLPHNRGLCPEPNEPDQSIRWVVQRTPNASTGSAFGHRRCRRIPWTHLYFILVALKRRRPRQLGIVEICCVLSVDRQSCSSIHLCRLQSSYRAATFNFRVPLYCFDPACAVSRCPRSQQRWQQQRRSLPSSFQPPRFQLPRARCASQVDV